MPEQIQKTLIEQELKTKYMDYAMSVIIGRALPDVRDGLKPVHRRILYAMLKEGLLSNRRYSKCAGVVGEVLKKYHPHGDTAVYDALVRMAQDFSLAYPLIDGHGNFGSVDGDPPAAYRYTEARLSKLAEELLADIEKDTVKFIPNYDDSTQEPTILPSKFPNLLVNGSSGIAVGMATNIPPHNMTEIIDATIHLINKGPTTPDEELIDIVKGPDFPTGATILGRTGIVNLYKTGRGKIIVRSKTNIEEKKDRKAIIVTEIPYQVNKSNLIEYIASLVRDKKVQGISDLRDESDRKGMRIVIELQRSANPEVTLNQLFKHTNMQLSYGFIMLAIVNGEPKIITLKETIHHYIIHRKEIIVNRTKFELQKAEKRAHILTGLLRALRYINPVIKLIKASQNPEIARAGLIKVYKLTPIQAQAILDMRLQRLTSLEQNRLRKEFEDLIKLITELKSILDSNKKIFDIMKKELLEVKQKHSKPRRTEFSEAEEEMEMGDMIKQEDVVVTLSHEGYIKKIPLETYRKQRRGGTGIIASRTKEEDYLEHLFVTSTHHTLLFFTNKGRIHWKKAFYIPSAERYAKGTPVVNVLKLDKDEKVTTLIPIDEFDEKRFLMMVTQKGKVKKISLNAFSKPRKAGVNAINLADKDILINVLLTDGKQQILMATKNGMAIKFHEKNVRPMGRAAAGVRGIRLGSKDTVVGTTIANDTVTLLTVAENGYGKRTRISDYRLINRGGKGVKNIKITTKTGIVIGVKSVMDKDELMFITKNGSIIRTPADGISTIGRNTQGVRIMKLKKEDKLIGVERVLTTTDNSEEKD